MTTTETNKPFAIPAGYVERSTDVVGFWDASAGPIHCVPLHVVFSDSKIESTKTSILIHARLVDDILLQASDDEDGDVIEAHAGELVGIWYKPGMSAIKDLAGVPVYMYEDGEKNTGKPNAMKVYRVLSKELGRPLTVLSDYRKESQKDERHTKHFKPAGGNGAVRGAAQNGLTREDDFSTNMF